MLREPEWETFPWEMYVTKRLEAQLEDESGVSVLERLISLAFMAIFRKTETLESQRHFQMPDVRIVESEDGEVRELKMTFTHCDLGEWDRWCAEAVAK